MKTLSLRTYIVLSSIVRYYILAHLLSISLNGSSPNTRRHATMNPRFKTALQNNPCYKSSI